MDAETTARNPFPSNPWVPFTTPILSIGSGLSLTNNAQGSLPGMYNPNTDATLSSSFGATPTVSTDGITVGGSGVNTSNSTKIHTVGQGSVFSCLQTQDIASGTTALNVKTDSTATYTRTNMDTSFGTIVDATGLFTTAKSGFWSASVSVTWPASATGYRVAYISVTPFGFSNQIRGNSITSVATGNNMTSTPMNSQYLPAGSTIQFFVVQNSGSTSTAQPIFLNIKWEGDIA